MTRTALGPACYTGGALNSHQAFTIPATMTSTSSSKSTRSWEDLKYNPSPSNRQKQTYTVTYRGRKINTKYGERLRNVLLRNGTPLHNGGRLITCKGLGTCGTCAVTIDGNVHPATRGLRESRLMFPPHSAKNADARGLRLACQVQIVGDIEVTKYNGFWGQGDIPMPDCVLQD